MIRSAGSDDHAARERAWNDLILRYRSAVLGTLRRHFAGDPACEDHVGDFFNYLYEKDLLQRADPDQGRFRCYLQGIIRRYALEVRRTRGGGSDIDENAVGGPDSSAVIDDRDTAGWAAAVMRNASTSLLKSKPRDGALFMQYYGIPPEERADRNALAEESGLTANALAVAVNRAKETFAACFNREIRDTVETEDDFERERAEICHALASHWDLAL